MPCPLPDSVPQPSVYIVSLAIHSLVGAAICANVSLADRGALGSISEIDRYCHSPLSVHVSSRVL